MTNMWTEALKLARKGLPVFPCRAEDKAPLTPHGFKGAAADPDIIHGWWTRWPEALIGVPTGEKFVVSTSTSSMSRRSSGTAAPTCRPPASTPPAPAAGTCCSSRITACAARPARFGRTSIRAAQAATSSGGRPVALRCSTQTCSPRCPTGYSRHSIRPLK